MVVDGGVRGNALADLARSRDKDQELFIHIGTHLVVGCGLERIGIRFYWVEVGFDRLESRFVEFDRIRSDSSGLSDRIGWDRIYLVFSGFI